MVRAILNEIKSNSSLRFGPQYILMICSSSYHRIYCLGIALANSKEGEEESTVVRSPADVPPESIQVLVACHSLVRFDEELVGDPLEKACLNWADWNLTKSMPFILVIYLGVRFSRSLFMWVTGCYPMVT